VVFGIILAITAIIAAVTVSAIVIYNAMVRSRQDADENFSNNDVAGEVEPCPQKSQEDANIISIEYLNGDDTTELGTDDKHFVNLPRDAKWVDGTHVMNIDRLGQKTRFKVRFNKPGQHGFKVIQNPDADNIEYSDAEKGRNDNFKFMGDEKSYTTKGDGTKIVEADFFISSAGKDKYSLVGRDDYGTPDVNSHTIESHRLIYYLEIKMRGLTSIATGLGTFEAEYAKHHITMVSAGSVEMDHMPNVGNIAPNDSDNFKIKARTVYDGSGQSIKEPYLVAIGYTDHLGVKNPNRTVLKANVEVGPGKPAVDLVPRGAGLTSAAEKDRYLWKNIVPGEKWFISAQFLPDGGTVGADEVNIPEPDCEAIPVNEATPDRCKKVRVKVSDLAAGTGTITLKINWVDRMRGGLSFGGGNLICVCTRSWWRNKSTDSQNETIIHEMGHKIGMVADGTGKLPDKVATHYTGKGHVGGHCHNGLSAELASYSGVHGSTCTIFGATNGVAVFCDNCKPAVRKMDVSEGWSAF